MRTLARQCDTVLECPDTGYSMFCHRFGFSGGQRKPRRFDFRVKTKQNKNKVKRAGSTTVSLPLSMKGAGSAAVLAVLGCFSLSSALSVVF